MTNSNKIFRYITFGLQLIAIAMFFVVPLLLGSNVSPFWLLMGVIHATMFAIVFFRNARTRTALSIILTILTILWCIFVLIMILLVFILETGIYGPMSSHAQFFTYFITSLLAIIFALAGPRRFPDSTTAATPYPMYANPPQSVYTNNQYPTYTNAPQSGYTNSSQLTYTNAPQSTSTENNFTNHTS
ncbi:MAG: hypothetical protein FWD05_10660 [Oscillospiraceae bacterium]|nr:hypothetical protein [Oscillospiraceae bacterium]